MVIVLEHAAKAHIQIMQLVQTPVTSNWLTALLDVETILIVKEIATERRSIVKKVSDKQRVRSISGL